MLSSRICNYRVVASIYFSLTEQLNRAVSIVTAAPAGGQLRKLEFVCLKSFASEGVLYMLKTFAFLSEDFNICILLLKIVINFKLTNLI